MLIFRGKRTAVEAYLIEQVGGFHQLGPEWVEEHVGGLQLPVVALRQCSEALPDGVIESMQADGIFHITTQHLQRVELISYKLRAKVQAWV